MAREDELGCGPCLVSLAHGTTGFSVSPFVELPLVRHAELVELCDFDEFLKCNISETQSVDKPNPLGADEWPNPAVVVVVRQVEQIDRVVTPPVGVP